MVQIDTSDHVNRTCRCDCPLRVFLMTSDTINRTEETLCINSIMADLIQKLVKSTKIQTKGSDVVHERVGCLS